MYGNCQYIKVPPPVNKENLTVCIEEKECSNIASPEVWGEAFWFILHLGSCHATKEITSKDASKYWGFIEGIPLMLPCRNCADHASMFIAMHKYRKAEICANRNSLIKFFVDFHNDVNKRSGKPLLSLRDVKRMFSGGARLVKKVSYY